MAEAMPTPAPRWVRAARWLLRVAIALAVLAAVLAGLAIREGQLERTCVDPPDDKGFFGCAWGHGLARYILTVQALVVALAAASAGLLAFVARGSARGDARAHRRAVALAIGSSIVGLASLALHLDGLGPCMQCPLWQHQPSQVILAGLELAWAPVVLVAAVTALASAGMARRLRAAGPGLETVK